LLSLRILARLDIGIPPSRRDLIILKRHASAADGDLPVQELCAAIIKRELEGGIGSTVASRDEGPERLTELAREAHYIARQREQRKISEAEYIQLLNVVRQRYGLYPIPTGESS